MWYVLNPNECVHVLSQALLVSCVLYRLVATYVSNRVTCTGTYEMTSLIKTFNEYSLGALPRSESSLTRKLKFREPALTKHTRRHSLTSVQMSWMSRKSHFYNPTVTQWWYNFTLYFHIAMHTNRKIPKQLLKYKLQLHIFQLRWDHFSHRRGHPSH